MLLSNSVNQLGNSLTAATGGNTQRFYSRIGVVTVVLALLTTGITFFILTGMTPVQPESNLTFILTGLNALLILALIVLIGREVYRISQARNRGKAASRLHVRLVVLFSLVAAVPAMLVAIVASVTLDLGLDRWFEMRTTTIVNSSISLANSYIQESARNLQGTTLEMVGDVDAQRSLYNLDRTSFTRFLTQQALGRGLIGAFIVRSNGEISVRADIRTGFTIPPVAKSILNTAQDGKPVLIPPERTNLLSAVVKLQQIPDMFLYTVRPVDGDILNSMRAIEGNNLDAGKLVANGVNTQILFALLYFGLTLTLLLSAIWTGIAVADRLVRPIRRSGDCAKRLDPERFQLPVQGRTFHADKLGCAGNIAAKPVDLRDEIFLLKALARLAQRQGHDVLVGFGWSLRQRIADFRRQQIGGDDRFRIIAARQDDQALNIVAQLADIARPGMGLQHGHGIRADLARLDTRLLGNLRHEEFHKRWNVVAPVRQRRNNHGNHRQPVKQVFAEPAFGDHRFEVLCGRGDNPHIHLDPLGAAYPFKLLVNEHAQDLVLRFARHVGNLVQVENTAMSFLQRPHLALAAIGFGAEQFYFHTFRRDGRGVQVDEWPLGTGRQGMDRPRREFLARAGRAGDHDAAVGRRDTFDGLAQVVHRQRCAEQFGAFRRALAQVGNLAPQLGCFKRPFGDKDQSVRLERLFDEIIGAAADGRNGGFDVAVTGNHDHGDIGMATLDLIQKGKTVEPAALHPDIQKDQAGNAIVDRRQCAVGIGGNTGLVSLVAQYSCNKLADVDFIVDDKNVRCHLNSPVSPMDRNCRLSVYWYGSWEKPCGSLHPARRENPQGHRAVQFDRHVLQRSF